MEIRNYSLKSKNGEQLAFGVFRGSITFTVFGANKAGRIGGGAFSDVVVSQIKAMCREISKARVPNTTKSITVRKRDYQTKQNTVLYVFGLTVDDKLRICVDLKLPGASYQLPFSGFISFDEDGTPATPARASELNFRTFYDWLCNEGTIGAAMTYEKSQSQGNNNQRQASRGDTAHTPAPAAPPASDVALDPDDDIPF